MLNTYSSEFIKDMGPELGSHYLELLPWFKNVVLQTVKGYYDRDAMARLFDVDASQVPQGHEEPWVKPLESYISRSGKCLRPYLVTLLLEAYGHDPHEWLPEVALVEIIHSASLILDDIADDSLYRRGELAAHKVYGTTVAGAAASGWLNLGAELVWLHRQQLGMDVTARLLRELAWEHYVTGVGTVVDVTWAWLREGKFSTDTYLQQVVHRSTSYTYRLPLKVGAITARAPEADIQALSQFGELLGLAFQLKDDMLNAASNDEHWGKEIGEDILEGKFTLQIIYALQHGTNEEREELLKILGFKGGDQELVAKAVKILRNTGAFAYCQSIAKEYCERSKACITSLTIAQKYKDMLTTFADYIVNRSR
jgi:geranylgeranyl pyrophosphate synthase